MNAHRLIKIGDALSQLANVTFLPRHRETTANESISGRCHRCGYVGLARIIDFIFKPWESDHCRKSHEKDLERARLLLKQEEDRT